MRHLFTVAMGLLLACGVLTRSRAADLAELEEEAMRAAVERVAPSVVRIQTVGGLAKVGKVRLGDGPCTGLVVSKDGYIISSLFNFARQPTTILVQLSDGTSQPARLIARDESRALALIKVDLPSGAAPLVVPEALADDAVRVGAWAIAVGRTFDAKRPNVSVGIVSAVNRIWGKAIQTDAKISPSNYGGPLVDISGRVMGVLVPMTPQTNQAVAGADWYDSGIGFAVPMSQIRNVLPRLKAGEDLHPGLMGVSLKGRDTFAEPIVAAAPARSPAAEAGVKAGDKIVEVNGRSVATQSQLKHQVSPLYAGDRITLVVMRGKDRKEFQFQLTDKLVPYDHPFLGVLPMREKSKEPGVVARYVYPESGAATAGLKSGDRMTSLAGKPVQQRDDLIEILAGYAPKERVVAVVVRKGKTLKLDVVLGRFPTDVPDKLPPANGSRVAPEEPGIEVGTMEIKLPEFENECVAFVPETYNPDATYGMVVWLPTPGQPATDERLADWKALCASHDLILLMPQPRDDQKWSPDEVEFIHRVYDHMAQRYAIQESRSVVLGRKAGGSMAMLYGFSEPAKVQGIAVVDAGIPRGVRPPSPAPTRRLAFFWATSAASKNAKQIETQIGQLGKMNYPITQRKLDGKRTSLNHADRSEVARWIDTLDRI